MRSFIFLVVLPEYLTQENPSGPYSLQLWFLKCNFHRSLIASVCMTLSIWTIDGVKDFCLSQTVQKTRNLLEDWDLDKLVWIQSSENKYSRCTHKRISTKQEESVQYEFVSDIFVISQLRLSLLYSRNVVVRLLFVEF